MRNGGGGGGGSLTVLIGTHGREVALRLLGDEALLERGTLG